MKKLNIFSITFIALMLMLFSPGKSMVQEGEYISDQEFYDELAPYGTWVYDEQYGNVWIPDVDQDFRPYATNGYWAMTAYGNTWVSDYPWGWAAFHYGRWRFDDYYGWEWIPGNEWAPAWVTWRNGGGYYGWAPLQPGISIDVSFGNDYYVPDNYWVFAPQQYISYTNIYNYYVPAYRVRSIINRTNYIHNRYAYNNRTYIGGPRREEIQRYTSRPVRIYNINNVNRPARVTVNNNNINIYRPTVRHNEDARPRRVIDGSAYRQLNPSERIGGTDRRRGTVYNPANASKLAETARSNRPDNNVVKVNTPDHNRENALGNRGVRANRPTVAGDAVQTEQRRIDRRQRNEIQQQLGNQRRQQQNNQENQQQEEQRRQQQQQLNEQRRQQQDQQLQQQEEQRRQQQQLNEQRRQQQDQQRQQQEEQRRQQQQQLNEQRRQQQDQQRQQQEEQRRQQQQQLNEQRRQQQDQQRQQQEQQRSSGGRPIRT
ncbi:DUF6600 domain-containing protein [Mucilaginibacter litoreus]|uniref:DUF6600 domain-containing protein n=1 Tax=Mucilaginibacter litoreus TaxID=1048221 RepID=A0ABW3ATW4_9SPHI